MRKGCREVYFFGASEEEGNMTTVKLHNEEIYNGHSVRNPIKVTKQAR
jgi:hypothetical protein